MRDQTRSGFSLGRIWNNAQLVYRLYQDDRVPSLLKVVVPLVVAAYFVMPLDLIPDFLPVVGQLDDLGVLILALSLFINLAPAAVVDEHRRGLGQTPRGGPDATTRLDPSGGAPTVVDARYSVNDRPQQ